MMHHNLQRQHKVVASVKGEVLSIIFSKWFGGVCVCLFIAFGFSKRGKCASESPTVCAKGGQFSVTNLNVPNPYLPTSLSF